MAEKRTDKAKRPRQPRTSVTFPKKLYRTLEMLAKEKKVSLAWVVREAAETYVRGQSFESNKTKGGLL